MPGLLLVFLGGGLPGVCGTVSVNRGGYPSFSDEVPFKITWPGPEFKLVGSLLVTRFRCFVYVKLKDKTRITPQHCHPGHMTDYVDTRPFAIVCGIKSQTSVC